MIQVLPNRVCSIAADRTDHRVCEKGASRVTAAKSSGQDTICSALESSIADAEQQLCPAVALRRSDVAMEECADIEDRVIREVEELIACPGSGSIDLSKTEVCDFIARTLASSTTLVSSSCTRVVQSA